jgi:hypothetical protein
MTTRLLLLAAVCALAGCAGHHRTLTLHASEHQSLKTTQVRAGTTIACVTHRETIRGRVPARSAAGADSTTDYDGSSGGSLSIGAKRSGILTVACS